MSESESRGGPGWASFLAAFAVLVAIMAVGFYLLWARLDDLTLSSKATQESVSDAQRLLAASQLQIEEQASQLTAAVSDIDTLASAVSDLGKTVETQSARMLDIPGLSAQVRPSVVTVHCGGSQGSGFAVDAGGAPSGYSTAILTNHHVIADCANDDGYEVWVEQGESQPATVLADYDTDNDLAVLFIDKELPALAFAETPQVGDPVLAIGSPYGLSDTVTSGSITNILDDLFTTDAAIGPGNSGGPLVDRSGMVLGVITAELERSEGQNLAVRVKVACRNILQCE